MRCVLKVRQVAVSIKCNKNNFEKCIFLIFSCFVALCGDQHAI